MKLPAIDAEARGKLRVWKAELDRQDKILDRVLNSVRMQRLVREFAVRSSAKGRQRVFEDLQAMLAPAGVELHHYTPDRKRPLAIWSTLRPMVNTRVLDIEADREYAVPGITVDFLAAGWCGPNIYGLDNAHWTLLVTDHTVGRILQRSRWATPTEVIRAAHRTVLEMAKPEPLSASFYIPCCGGKFICRLAHSRFKGSDENQGTLVHVRTWLSDDEEMRPPVPTLAKGEPPDRLSDTCLMPRPLWEMLARKKGIAT